MIFARPQNGIPFKDLAQIQAIIHQTANKVMSSARANAHASGSTLRPSASGVVSGTGGGSGTSTPQNAQSQKTDIYRPIAAAIQVRLTTTSRR